MTPTAPVGGSGLAVAPCGRRRPMRKQRERLERETREHVQRTRERLGEFAARAAQRSLAGRNDGAAGPEPARRSPGWNVHVLIHIEMS